MGLLKWLDENLERVILASMLILISCLLMFQVVMRYIFHNALGWPEELARYGFVMFCFITLGFSIRYNLNFRVDFLDKALPRMGKELLNVLIDLLFAFFYSYLFIFALNVIKAAKATGNVTPGLQMPVYILYILGSAGLFIGALRAIQGILVRVISLVKESEKVAE